MQENMPISVIVLDDHPIMRAGISAILSGNQSIRIVGEAASGEEAIKLIAQLQPNVVLIDLALPDLNGVEVIRRARPLSPGTQFVILTTYEGDEDIHQALSAGARGYVIKGMPHQTLLDAIQRVHSSKLFLPPTVQRSLARRTGGPILSERERQVLLLAVDGLSNREIGQKLNITEATVKGHMTLIFSKLQVKDRVQAVTTALHRGIARL